MNSPIVSRECRGGCLIATMKSWRADIRDERWDVVLLKQLLRERTCGGGERLLDGAVHKYQTHWLRWSRDGDRARSEEYLLDICRVHLHRAVGTLQPAEHHHQITDALDLPSPLHHRSISLHYPQNRTLSGYDRRSVGVKRSALLQRLSFYHRSLVELNCFCFREMSKHMHGFK